MHAAVDGYFTRNVLQWSCSAFDLDVSKRIVWEDNTVQCMQVCNVCLTVMLFSIP